MSRPSLQDVFLLKRLIENIKIKICTRVENGVKQLIALVTENGHLVLHYTFGELPAVVKNIPWLEESAKSIQAICFDPTATWLLLITLEGSLYIIPALSLVDRKQKVDCKWSVNDFTQFPKHPNLPESKPISAVWWQTLDCNQNAFVGFENGSIALISLTDGKCLSVSAVSEAASHLHICQDNSLDTTYLLINGDNGHQWRLALEHKSTGYSFPHDSNNSVEECSKSRLHSLKQMGVDKLNSLKQRIVEGKPARRNSQTSESNSESSHSDSSSVPEPLPHLRDTYFSTQHARHRYLFCAFYRPSSLLTVHGVDIETAPLFTYKLPPKTEFILLTDRLIFGIDESYHNVFVVSTHFSECSLEGETEFNEEALVSKFCFEDEQILQIFKITDTTIIKTKNNDNKKDKTYVLPKSLEEANLPKYRIDTCIVVTTSAVYKLIFSTPPVKRFINLVITPESNLVKAEKLANVFGLNMQQLLEICGDLLMVNHSYQSALMLYKQAKVHILKRVLKLAITADCKALLKFINLCLSSSKVDMSMATKIHIGNLAVMAHTELVLRNSGPTRLSYTKDFMAFLCYEEYYDQVLAVNVACQAGHWNVVALLAKSRGLQPEVIAALSQVIQSCHNIRETVGQFLYALSEPSLSQNLLIYSTCSIPILTYIRAHLHEFNVSILKRFFKQLDPSQPAVLPIVSKMFLQSKQSNGDLESTLDSLEFDLTLGNIVIKDFLETFIMVALHLIEKTGDSTYNINLLEKIATQKEFNSSAEKLHTFPALKHLSCGYEHAAVIRNNSVYTMGLATAGCLGIGPLLTQSSGPKVVQTLVDLKVKALSVSCGRKHTLVLTDYGVYSWGSNNYGQLGLGHFVQESPYPQMISSFCDKHIVDVGCGQYHSMALTSCGEVFTWGWGVHGQLGHGNSDNQYEPKLLDFSTQVMQIAGGHAHSIILAVDGKIYGFGSNCFGQLGSCNVDSSKTTRPIWILIMPDIYTPVEKISTAYFHNIAIRADQEVFIWGANPQEVRLAQSKFSQRLNEFGSKAYEPWKASHNIYSSRQQQRAIDDVAAGYRHNAILHGGRLLWGRGRDGDLGEARVKEHDFSNALGQKFTQVSCGSDYIMAIDQSGKVFAWGSNNMAQTILGKPYEEQRQSDGKVLIFKNTKRVVKIPSTVSGNGEGYPIEVPGIPSPSITYNTSDLRSNESRYKNHLMYLSDDNEFKPTFRPPSSRRNFDPSFVELVPNISLTQKMLHNILEAFSGFYDNELILTKCLQLNNLQAASKLAMLDDHFGDSLNYQLKAFKCYMETYSLNLDLQLKNEEYDINLMMGDLCPKSEKIEFSGIKFEFTSLSNSSGNILSTSSSLDSIQQWGDDPDHQGGRESPCEVTDLDVKQSVSHYVQSVKNDNVPCITSMANLAEKPVLNCDKTVDIEYEIGLLIKDSKTKEMVQMAAIIVEFYIKKTYTSENHILMQNILLKCIEFWLCNNLPISILEIILLKNMDKYFYPLSILLFCKNFNNNLNDELVQNGLFHQKTNSAGFLKEFSTKFCLHLCSLVLENVNKA